jgi:hypothetical protein
LTGRTSSFRDKQQAAEKGTALFAKAKHRHSEFGDPFAITETVS